MKTCIDVDYQGPCALAACVVFDGWCDATPQAKHKKTITDVAPYVPGQFYLRELPCLLAVLGELAAPPELVIVDGYVWLDNDHHPGLGAYLYDALQQQVVVVGVAKTRFARSNVAIEVLRGDSRKPLYVTAAGMDPETAAEHIAAMHGPFRIPTLLKLVDQLSKEGRSCPNR